MFNWKQFKTKPFITREYVGQNTRRRKIIAVLFLQSEKNVSLLNYYERLIKGS